MGQTSMSTDLAVPDFAAEVERAADPSEFVVQALERAKAWLTDALEHGEIDAIVEMRSQAEAIRVYTTSKQLGRDAELTAQEIVRRAERGIGVAIRRGQELGEIGTTKDARSYAGRVRQHSGNTDLVERKRFPSDLVPSDDLSGNGAGIYHLTDRVTDDQFERALDEAKAERNLSRANLVRKVAAIQDAENPPPPPPKKKPGRRPYPDAFRDASYDLLKAVEKVARLVLEDDRFPEHAARVATMHHHEITRARDLLVDVASRITSREKE